MTPAERLREHERMLSLLAALEVRPTDDLPDVVALLEVAGLPTADLAAGTAIRFVGARRPDGDLYGVAGLEPVGEWALVRSVAVEAHVRGVGLGGRLVGAIEATARAAGGRSLVLLTTTAEAFFAERGYQPVERTALPPEVLALPEFRSVCPSTAACLCKRLD